MYRLKIFLQSGIVRLRNDRYYRNALLFVSASLITSGLNYLYYPIMGRMLGLESYGELQVVTSFLLQLTTVFTGLNLISVNIVANHDEEQSKTLIVALQKTVFWFVTIACIGVLLASPALEQFFHFGSAWPFILLTPALLVDAIAVFWTAYLQGKHDFKSLSIYSILTGAGKIVFSVVFILMGMGVAGGILGIVVGLWLSLLAVRFVTKHELPPLLQTLSWPTKHEITLIKHHLGFIVEVIVSLIAMSILLSIDVMLVKHFFSPEFAGQYSGVSTVSRIIFYASAPLVAVMLPAITLRNLQTNMQAFHRTLAISVTVCLAGLLLFSVFAYPIMRILLGNDFARASSWLPLLSIIALLVTLTNVIVNYLLAVRSHLALWISLVSLVASGILLVLHHATIYQIVFSTSAGLVLGQTIFWATYIAKRTKIAPSAGLDG